MNLRKITKTHLFIILVIGVGILLTLFLVSRSGTDKSEIIRIGTSTSDCKKVLAGLEGKEGKDLDANLALWQIKLECYSRERQYDDALLTLDFIEKAYDQKGTTGLVDIDEKRSSIKRAKNDSGSIDEDDVRRGRQDDGSYLGP